MMYSSEAEWFSEMVYGIKSLGGCSIEPRCFTIEEQLREESL
jgi:hypothetical protein